LRKTTALDAGLFTPKRIALKMYYFVFFQVPKIKEDDIEMKKRKRKEEGEKEKKPRKKVPKQLGYVKLNQMRELVSQYDCFSFQRDIVTIN
jgi:hypothetical protein